MTILKIKNWIKRFLPAEIICIITAIGFAQICRFFTTNNLIIGYAGSAGEAIGFYSTIFIQKYLSEDLKITVKPSLSKIATNILKEFGAAALIDGLLLRPFFMYLLPILLNNLTLGIIVGKLLGDVSFYALVIISSEITEYHHKKKSL